MALFAVAGMQPEAAPGARTLGDSDSQDSGGWLGVVPGQRTGMGPGWTSLCGQRTVRRLGGACVGKRTHAVECPL